MLIVLSPAKALDFTAPPPSVGMTAPELADQTAELARVAKKLRVIDLKRMMDLSDSLAKLNRERFQAFQPDSEDGLQAAFAFNGDVYLGLKARELDRKALGWAQDHLRILSGLYGVLRPLDAIQPYRLEMGVRLKTRRGYRSLRTAAGLVPGLRPMLHAAVGTAARDHPEHPPPQPVA